MHRSFILILFFFIVFDMVSFSAYSQNIESTAQSNMAQLIEQAKSSVVSIKAYQKIGNKKSCRVGSGFIFDSNGLIVTRPSVVEGSDKVTVLFSDGRSAPGIILSADRHHHVALLKVALDGLLSLSFGKTSELRNYDKLAMLGNSLGVFPSVTLGTFMGKQLNGMMGIDIVVPPGNSGSPIINTKGGIVGLMAGRISTKEQEKDQTVGYFLPIEKVMQSVDYILGEIGGWIGISAVNLEENSNQHGVRVVNVVRGGPADRAGICAGDTIVSFEKKKIHNVRTLAEWVKYTIPGQKINFDMLNSTGTFRVTVEVQKRP